jgi:hypothetical protein
MESSKQKENRKNERDGNAMKLITLKERKMLRMQNEHTTKKQACPTKFSLCSFA